jgi:hypothetical protein
LYCRHEVIARCLRDYERNELNVVSDNLKHHEWAGKLAHKFGNAAVMGAGATFGADLVNDAMRRF